MARILSTSSLEFGGKMLHNNRAVAKFSTAILATLACQSMSFYNIASHAQSSEAGSPGEIRQWTTAADRKMVEINKIDWSHRTKASPDDIVINPGKKAQTILGFGAALTDAACYMVNQLSPEAKQKLINQLYSPSEMGLSIGRVCIGSSDYATIAYSYDDGEADPELKRFSIDHDKKWILPVLRMARQANPSLYLFGSPWSPPGWMKPNKSMLGGCMTRTYLSSYANYFLKFLKSYEAEGVPIQAVTVQNETDTDQEGRMPACAWPQEYEMDFVGNHLGPLLEKHGVATKIWIIDHNYTLWGRALDELEDPNVLKYTNAVAWHGYGGKVNSMMKVQNAHPKLDMHWTEGGPDYTDPKYATNWTTWSDTFTGILRNSCRSITAWNLALDEVGKPNIGPFPCGGLVTINSKTKDISYSGQYWAMNHYCRFIKPGSTIISSESGQSEVKHVAARTPDGKIVVVLTNPGSSREVQIRIGTESALIPLPADSVSTISFSS